MARSAQVIVTSLFDRQRLGRYAEWFAVAVAVALPWSTTLSGVFITLWLVTLLASLDLLQLRHKPWIPMGGLPVPVALWTLAVVGMLWAHAPLAERIAGVNSFHKLLTIPLLMFQFRETDRGKWVLIGFLVSCTVMLIVSWGLVLLPGLPWRGRSWGAGGRPMIGMPIKDYIAQSTMFTLCIFGLAEAALLAWRKAYRGLALTLLMLGVRRDQPHGFGCASHIARAVRVHATGMEERGRPARRNDGACRCGVGHFPIPAGARDRFLGGGEEL
jgi:O-antigen ligase